eukprot:31032-Pelagococcus_subviridis.AAC.11
MRSLFKHFRTICFGAFFSVRQLIHDQPRQPAPEVDALVEYERQRARDEELAEVVQDDLPPRGHLRVHERLRGRELTEEVVERDVAQRLRVDRDRLRRADAGDHAEEEREEKTHTAVHVEERHFVRRAAL